MTDARLRSLERAAIDDPAAAEALITERIRAGGRDPRHDPRPGDVVEPVPSSWSGWSRDTRTVERADADYVWWIRRDALGRREDRRTLWGWRRWANGGRVLRVAP